jgi:hypothetical protein
MPVGVEENAPHRWLWLVAGLPPTHGHGTRHALYGARHRAALRGHPQCNGHPVEHTTCSLGPFGWRARCWTTVDRGVRSAFRRQGVTAVNTPTRRCPSPRNSPGNPMPGEAVEVPNTLGRPSRHPRRPLLDPSTNRHVRVAPR